MRNHLFAALAAASLCATAGCDPAVNCTLESIVSVTATVEDAAGNPIDDATVVYAVDGGAEAACENLGAGDYACGADEAGDFVITADRDGFATGQNGVTVEDTDDGCHVVPQTVTVTLLDEGPAFE
jgi:hypothetical protein